MWRASFSIFLMILIKELRRESTVHEARHCVEMRGLGGWRATDMNVLLTTTTLLRSSEIYT